MQSPNTAQDAPHTVRNRMPLAFLSAIPIAILGGLIGLGGAEFRLPVLAGPLGYSARKAVPLNLAVSLTTIIASLLIRGRTLSLLPLVPFVPSMLALIGGAVVAAFFGASLSGRLSNEQLERVILVLLLGIGCALIVEGFLPQDVPGLLPDALLWRVVAGIVFGLAIGLVSSLLGVAGGELIIPTMLFAFGADIKTAGTACGAAALRRPGRIQRTARPGGNRGADERWFCHWCNHRWVADRHCASRCAQNRPWYHSDCFGASHLPAYT
jgi:uncharacterized membrane protein YfcA